MIETYRKPYLSKVLFIFALTKFSSSMQVKKIPSNNRQNPNINNYAISGAFVPSHTVPVVVTPLKGGG